MPFSDLNVSPVFSHWFGDYNNDGGAMMEEKNVMLLGDGSQDDAQVQDDVIRHEASQHETRHVGMRYC